MKSKYSFATILILVIVLAACTDDADVALPRALASLTPTSTVHPTTIQKSPPTSILEPASTPISTTDAITDVCRLQAEESMMLIEPVYAMMPLPPQGAELIYQGRIEFCEPYSNGTIFQHYGLWSLYGFSQPGFTINEYYWDILSAQGWIAYRTMSTGPRPIFCHPDYDAIEVDAPHDWAAHIYDPPAPEDLVAKAKENYQTLFSISVMHWPSGLTRECTDIGILP